jgi:hypothetical protein
MTMTKKHLRKTDSQDQVLRFVETARALGCDEDKERFEKALGKIARHKPPSGAPPKPKIPKVKKSCR